jgi:hypothetical protein
MDIKSEKKRGRGRGTVVRVLITGRYVEQEQARNKESSYSSVTLENEENKRYMYERMRGMRCKCMNGNVDGYAKSASISCSRISSIGM